MPTRKIDAFLIRFDEERGLHIDASISNMDVERVEALVETGEAVLTKAAQQYINSFYEDD